METALLILLPILTAGCTIATFFIARHNEARHNGKTDGALKSDIEYIKRRSEDTLLELRELNKTLDAHAERLARVEESAKQAHKRIDEIKNGGN